MSELSCLLYELHIHRIRYNRIFPALARSKSGTSLSPDGIWAKNKKWHDGSELTLEFVNGTSKTLQKTAVPSERYFTYQNGTQLYEIECLPHTLQSAVVSKVAEQASEISGLPDTKWSISGNSISGYYSSLKGLEDTAILLLPTFGAPPADVAKFTIDFLQNATAAGKKNVLIDVTANNGGYMSTGIDMSRIFFPESFPYTATRYRAHDAAKYLTKAYSRSSTTDSSSDSSNIFAFKEMVAPDQKSGFSSWQDLYGPHEALGSSSSNLLANFNYTASSTKVWPINGYGEAPLNPAKALFPADKISIVSLTFVQFPSSKWLMHILPDN